MLRKSLLTILLASTFTIAHAESCPTMNDLKHNNLQGWTAYDIDNGIPYSNLKDFEYNARAFALAEFSKGAPEGEAHCYFYHQNPSLGYGHAYLAKRNLVSSNNYAWKNSKGAQCTTSDDNCQCRAGDDTCQFVPAN